VTLTEFLLARIAEREEVAYAAIEPPPGYKPRPEDHPLVLDARRVLAICEAHRLIVAEHRYAEQGRDAILRILAAIDADHPDYREATS
jgi:hypothetical protein